ncbi:MAG: ABC transporter permease [Acidimicrobiales bacterium]
MTFLQFLSQNEGTLLQAAGGQIAVVAVVTGVATLVAVSLGILATRVHWTEGLVSNTVGVLFTVPSLAFFGIMIPILGLGFIPAAVVLVVYALLPIFRNTVAGLNGVPADVKEAAASCGLSARQRLVRIELPLAWPVIMAGIRVAVTLTMGLAAVGAYVGGPGFGHQIFLGIQQVGSPVALDLVVSGTLGVVILALLADGLLRFVLVVTRPRGLARLRAA